MQLSWKQIYHIETAKLFLLCTEGMNFNTQINAEGNVNAIIQMNKHPGEFITENIPMHILNPLPIQSTRASIYPINAPEYHINENVPRTHTNQRSIPPPSGQYNQ